MNNTTTPSSLERLYPAEVLQTETIAGSDTLQLHLDRYHFAGKNIVAGTIADIACGAGYGSHLLVTEYSEKINQLFAVDNNSEAISYANEHYKHPSISFQLSDAFSFQSSVPLNTIISLETIEHLAEPEKFVAHLAAQLAAGGRFIASAPVTPSMDANPYHLQDFTSHSFKKIFTDAGLVEIHSMIQKQPYRPFQLFRKKKGRGEHIRKGMAGYYIKHPAKFWLRIKSLLSDGFTNKYLVVVYEKR